MRKADVVRHFGNQVKIAQALKLTKGAVSQWPELVPLKSAIRLQAVTHGALQVDMAAYQLPSFSEGRGIRSRPVNQA